VEQEILRKAHGDARFRAAATTWRELTPNWIRIPSDDPGLRRRPAYPANHGRAAEELEGPGETTLLARAAGIPRASRPGRDAGICRRFRGLDDSLPPIEPAT